MERRILLFASIGILAIIPMIVLQSSPPIPLPDVTSVTTTDIPSGNYAVMVDLHGDEYAPSHNPITEVNKI